MSDTTPEADAAFTAMFAERSASDRVKMACGMFDAPGRSWPQTFAPGIRGFLPPTRAKIIAALG